MKIHNHTLPKAIRRHSIRRWLATAITMTAMLTATLATLTGCSADNDPETATGGDGTSVTFGATIAAREGHDNGNAPASRAIPDGTFEEGDQILVHMDGKRKAFIYSTAQGFVHAPNYPGTNVDPTPPVWKSGEAEKSVLAYGTTACIFFTADMEYEYKASVLQYRMMTVSISIAIMSIPHRHSTAAIPRLVSATAWRASSSGCVPAAPSRMRTWQAPPCCWATRTFLQ